MPLTPKKGEQSETDSSSSFVTGTLATARVPCDIVASISSNNNHHHHLKRHSIRCTDTMDGGTPADEGTTDDPAAPGSSLSTLLVALLTLAVYLFFLKPTAEERNGTGAAERRRQAGQEDDPRRRPARRPRQQQQQHQQQQQQQQQQAQAPRRRTPGLSEAAAEALAPCRRLPPHLVSGQPSPSAAGIIGGGSFLSDNGLVSFSHTRAAAEARKTAGDEEGLASARKERARILSRLFAALEKTSRAPAAAVPSRGSVFVLGVSLQRHLEDRAQRSSVARAVRGLAAHYTVLVVVAVEENKGRSKGGGESGSLVAETQEAHETVVGLLRGNANGNGDGNGDGDGETRTSGVPESVLPAHRILLASSVLGRVALVRQLSSNIGLTVDFDPEARTQLERFGYKVAVVDDWTAVL